MNKDELVVKHNSLIRSRYDYTLAELRLVIAIASMIQADDVDFHEYVVNAKTYANLMNVDERETRKAIKQLGKMLLSKPLEIPLDGGAFILANWFSSYTYRNGKIAVSFDPKLKPYLLELKEQFTKYKIENILKMKSAYSIRLYELAKSWEARGNFSITLREFKRLMGIEDKYKNYADVKRYIIERAIMEINKLTDIKIKFKELKDGRKVSELEFRINGVNPSHKDPLRSRRAFIQYVRKNRVNETLLHVQSTITGMLMELAVSPTGKLYDKKSIYDFDPEVADELWEIIYRTALDDRDTERLN